MPDKFAVTFQSTHTDNQDKAIREKLIVRGCGSLTNSELLSILIQSGPGSAIERAERIMGNHGGSLSQLYGADISRLRMSEGIGIKKAAVISAALELGRRLAIEEAQAPLTISNSEDIINIFRPQLAKLPHEEFWVIYLSSANTVIDKVKMSQGGVSATVVDHKLIVKRALELLASSLILVHNHPSGISSPSEEDRLLTNKIITASSLFDINVLDHMIITSAECFSFRACGLI